MEKIHTWGLWLIQIAIGIAIGVALALNIDVDPTAWLNLIASVMGAAITVVGALIVVNHQQNTVARQTRRLLLDQITAAEARIAQIRTLDPTLASTPGMRRSYAEMLQEQLFTLRESRQWVKPETASMVSALRFIGNMDPYVVVSTISADGEMHIHEQELSDRLMLLESTLLVAKAHLDKA